MDLDLPSLDAVITVRECDRVWNEKSFSQPHLLLGTKGVPKASTGDFSERAASAHRYTEGICRKGISASFTDSC